MFHPEPGRQRGAGADARLPGTPPRSAFLCSMLALDGPSAAAATAMGIAIGAVTISPIALAILERSTIREHALSPAAQIGSSMWKAVKRPVVWAPVLGVVAALLQLRLPDFVNRSLTVMGSATAGTALFLTGLIVSAQRFTRRTSDRGDCGEEPPAAGALPGCRLDDRALRGRDALCRSDSQAIPCAASSAWYSARDSIPLRSPPVPA